MSSSTELWVSRGTSLQAPLSASHFRKADPPPLGDRYGWWNDETIAQRMPGGSVMTFDLSKLTLDDYRVMRTDYQLNASLNVLHALIAQSDFSIYTKGEETDPKAKTISNVIEEGIRKQWIPFIRALATSLWAGFSPMALVYELSSEGYYEVTRYKDLTPEDCRVNWETTKGADGTPIRKFNGITNGGKVIPPMNSFWFPILMENGNYYGRKLLQPAFPPWFFSQLIHLYTNRYFERFGEPTMVGYYPADETVTNSDGTITSSREVMTNVLTSMRNRGVVTMPSSREPETKEREWEIAYLEAQMRGADFDRYLDRLDEEKSLALFTPVLLFRTGDRGSYNLVGQHLLVFQWILNALVGDVKTYADQFLVKRLHDVNFGPNAPRSEIRFRTLGRLDDAGAMTILQALIQNGGARVAQSGLNDLGNQIGIDLEYVTGAASPDATASLDPTVSALLPKVMRQPEAAPARDQLVAARRRLEDQVSRLFDQRSGYDLEYALSRVKLGFKGGFVNEMSHLGVPQDDADAAFHGFESDIRRRIAQASNLDDALDAIQGAYASHGITTR